MSTPTSPGGTDRDPLTDPLSDPPTQPVAQPLSGDEASVVRHEERAEVGYEQHETGRVRVRKHVETVPVEQVVPRNVEQVDVSERVEVDEHDSGEVIQLEDGSVSIPVFEEVLVVTKKLVVRERVIVRKETVVDEYTLQTELRREHVTVDADDGVLLEGDAGADRGSRSDLDADRDLEGPGRP